MFRIGIMTFHFAHNYGAMLQAYALKKYLQTIGCTAEIINYESDDFSAQYRLRPFLPSKNPVWTVQNALQYRQKRLQADLFQMFEQTDLGVTGELLSTAAQAEQKAAEYDLVIVGSDQVWNLNLTQGDKTYFLEGLTENTKRVSYAISCGDCRFADSEVMSALHKFQAISVRERQTLQELQSAGIAARVCVDPAFLLPKEAWEALGTRSRLSWSKGRYLLYYALQETDILLEKTREISQRDHLRICIVDGKLGKKRMRGEYLRNVGPIEFLRLLLDAEIVCTNSFHALVFSILFDKKIRIVPTVRTGNRMRDLLATLGVTEFDRVIDCGKLDKTKLTLLVQESMTFLQNILHDPAHTSSVAAHREGDFGL